MPHHSLHYILDKPLGQYITYYKNVMVLSNIAVGQQSNFDFTIARFVLHLKQKQNIP